MWLLICESGDKSALWAYQGLKFRGLEPLELVTNDALAHGVHWEHRVGTAGVYTEITLADNRKICNKDLHGVINRILFAPAECLNIIHPTERAYINQELNTFFLSWLYSLPQPVINRPTPHGLSGQWRPSSEWIYLASGAGLPTPTYRQSSRDIVKSLYNQIEPVPRETTVKKIIVLNGLVVGTSVSAHIQEGCRRLAEMSRTTLLGLEFAFEPNDNWTFVNATTHPDLEIGGEALLDALAIMLKDEAGKKS